MLEAVVAVMLVTRITAGVFDVAPGDVAPLPIPESDVRVVEGDVRVVEGEVSSWGAGTLVILADGGERWTFDLSRATEAPEPLVSGARVQVEFVEGETSAEALVVVLAPEGPLP